MEEITLSEGLCEIEWRAFSSCKSLNEVTLPTTLSVIDEYIFSNCEKLQKVTILCPINLKYPIFEDCRNIKTIILGSGIKKFCNNFFASFEDSLETIYVPYKKTDYYIKRLPEKFHSLIKELPK